MSNFNLNKLMLGGRLTSDVELRQTPKGDSVTSGTVAVNRRMKGADGTYPTDFFSFVAWHKNAELIAVMDANKAASMTKILAQEKEAAAEQADAHSDCFIQLLNMVTAPFRTTLQ